MIAPWIYKVGIEQKLVRLKILAWNVSLYRVIKVFQTTPKHLFWNGVVVAVVILELLFQAVQIVWE